MKASTASVPSCRMDSFESSSTTSFESSSKNEYGMPALSCKPLQPKRKRSGTEDFIPSEILKSQHYRLSLHE